MLAVRGHSDLTEKTFNKLVLIHFTEVPITEICITIYGNIREFNPKAGQEGSSWKASQS